MSVEVVKESGELSQVGYHSYGPGLTAAGLESPQMEQFHLACRCFDPGGTVPLTRVGDEAPIHLVHRESCQSVFTDSGVKRGKFTGAERRKEWKFELATDGTVRLHSSVHQLAESAWNRLLEYPWPGNVRELENILTRAVVLCRDDTITPDLLGISLYEVRGEAEGAARKEETELISLEALESRQVRNILEHTRWHKGRACEILGISRPALERKINKYGLNR